VVERGGAGGISVWANGDGAEIVELFDFSGGEARLEVQALLRAALLLRAMQDAQHDDVWWP
jgi:hypothetical protein